MKDLTKYIYESYSDTELLDVKVYYSVSPDVVTLTAPENYSESDIQAYLSDRFLNELPGGDTVKAKKFFGKNAQNIYDAYFEYEKFERTSNLPETVTFAWDNKYDETKKDSKLSCFTIKNMYYILGFDKFLVKKDTTDDLHKVLDKIFEATGDNEYNDYSIVITYVPDKLEFKEQ